jgi:septum formation protein
VLRLASGSPRRIELLRAIGLTFEVAPAQVDERRFASPAAAKADVAARAGAATLAADTEVRYDGERMGKPRGDADAVAMLATLAGETHDVRTEVVVVGASGRRASFGVTSRVTFRSLSLRDIERYVGTGEPIDKAGAYAIQGEGRRLVASYDGCFANVTGLPLCHVYHALRRVGIVAAQRPERACQSHFAFTCPVWRIAQRQGHALRDGGEYESWQDDVSGATGRK